VFVFLILALAVAPSRVSADLAFPQSGSILTYSTITTAKTSQGSVTADSTDSYSFQQVGSQWNVTETITGKIVCSPSGAQVSVQFHTTSDIMGATVAVSTSPNIKIRVSYMMENRIVKSTLIGPNVPAGYSAKCTLGGVDLGSVGQDTGALYASSLRYYVLFYIQTAGVTKGSVVPVSLLTATISGTQNVTVLNTSRPALVGALTGLISGSLYWDRDSGILLLAESTSSVESERILLVNSTFPLAAATSAKVSAASSQATAYASSASVISTTFTSRTQIPLESPPFATTGLIGLGVAALLAAVVLVIVLRRRRSTTGKAVERSPLTSEPEYRLCLFCGAKIPQGRARCPECGRFW
jgi:hypothetical protein